MNDIIDSGRSIVLNVYHTVQKSDQLLLPFTSVWQIIELGDES